MYNYLDIVCPNTCNVLKVNWREKDKQNVTATFTKQRVEKIWSINKTSYQRHKCHRVWKLFKPLNWGHSWGTNVNRLWGFMLRDSRGSICLAEEKSSFPASWCLPHVTGEGRAQLEVRLSRNQPLPLVSVLSVLSQGLQENMLDLSHHVTAKLDVAVESAL